MIRTSIRSALVAVPMMLAAGCAASTASAPVDVTRFHLGDAIGRGTIAVTALSTNDTVSPEFQTYADSVSRELRGVGFAPDANAIGADYVASVALTRRGLGAVRQESPVRLGLGGGTGGSGVGVGGGLSFGLGGKTRELIGSDLGVQIRRRSDSTVVWEGHAVTQTLTGTDGGQPVTVAAKLAKALFKNFPGESGITVTVK